MKKFLLAAAVIVAFGGYLLYANYGGKTAVNAPSGFETNAPVSAAPSEGDDDVLPPGRGPVQHIPAANGPISDTRGYKDGSYDGPAIDAIYGTVQVKAVISGGRITDVQWLQHPDAPGHTTEVSRIAMPLLTSEAIAVQSAKVDLVSGATQTSEGFQQSLEGALAQA